MVDDKAQQILEELDRFRSRYQQLNERIIDQGISLDWHTENEVVLLNGAMRLRKFKGGTAKNIPLLIVYSHVNRPCIIDLDQAHSLIQCLLRHGHPIYLLDWGEVAESDCSNDLSKYVHDYLDIAVDFMITETDLPSINLLGICQGGTFALCYASLMPNKIHKIVTLATPVDFHQGTSVITHWAQHIEFSLLEQNPQNIPGSLITLVFQMIRPFADLVRQVDQIEKFDQSTELEFMMKMDQWIYQCPDQPGKAFTQFMAWFYQDNALALGTLNISGRKVILSKLKCPILNVYAEHDHLVPPESSMALKQLVASNHYQELKFPGGHVGLLVSSKSIHTVLPKVGQWLAG